MGVPGARGDAFRETLAEGGDAAAVGCGYEQGGTEAEAGEVGERGFGRDAVYLVRDEQRAGAATTEVVRDLFVRCVEAFAGVDQEHHPIGLVDRDVRLLSYERCHRRVVDIVREAARVDENHGVPVEVGNAVLAVAGESGPIRDQRVAGRRQPVEQGGFPNIRPAHEGDDGHVLRLISSAFNRPSLVST